METLVSVVVPVYNVEKYLEECLSSLLNQTVKDIEIICVDDGSTDQSLSILDDFKNKDSRVQVISQKNGGAGAARNNGIQYAKGKYIYFFDSDDIAAPNLLEKAVNRAEEANADIVAFNGYTFVNDDVKTKKLKRGFNNNIVKDASSVFSYRDYPQSILSIVNVVPWNKLIRTDFIKENDIRFEEISSTNDITFSAVCAARAQRIALVDSALMFYRLGHTGTVSSTKQKNLNNVVTAVESVVNQLEKLDYYDRIIPSVMRFMIDNYCFSFMNYTKDFSTDISKEFYEYISKRFNSPLFDGMKREYLSTERLYAMYKTIKSTSYDEMLSRRSRDIIVSFTTYPKRISTIHMVVDNISRQTMKPDKVFLYLAAEQFPKREAELPPSLQKQMYEGSVEIKWCDDIRSHKKYFYAMQDYPESLIITVDDDLVYPDDMIENLYYSYLCNPDCVSAMRAHIVAVNNLDKTIKSYNSWPKEYRGKTLTPSMQLFATSGAGTLYPPNAVNERAFNKKKIAELCPLADDVWLHMMQLVNNTPVVCASNGFYINFIDGTQADSLFAVNVEDGQNDVQYNAVREWLKSEFGKDIVYEKLTSNPSELSFVGYDALLDYIAFLQDCDLEVHKKLKQAYTEKSEINAKLQQTYKEKADRGKEINSLKAESKRLNAQIKKLDSQVSRLEAHNEKLKKFSLYPLFKFLKNLFKRK